MVLVLFKGQIRLEVDKVLFVPLEKDRGIRLGSESRQSSNLPVDGKKLVIMLPIKKNNTRNREKNVFKSPQRILWFPGTLYPKHWEESDESGR